MGAVSLTNGGSVFSINWAGASFTEGETITVNFAAVPGPIVGAGLPGLVISLEKVAAASFDHLVGAGEQGKCHINFHGNARAPAATART